MIKKKFDAAIPRKMYWADEIADPRRCPECNAKLEKEYHSYLVATRQGNKPFMTGNDDGYFCPNCPVVVLDHNTFAEILSCSPEFSASSEFVVLGIVNLNAIPESKKKMQLGTDDNPIPLVAFTNYSNNNTQADRLEKNDNLTKQEIGRNQPCPCGSGKKYKKCCGKNTPIL